VHFFHCSVAPVHVNLGTVPRILELRTSNLVLLVEDRRNLGFRYGKHIQRDSEFDIFSLDE